MSSGDADEVAAFLAVMRRLRAECPWKREQTHRSLQRYLLEEAYETLEAIDAGDRSGDWSHLREELGDLLLQVVFHAVIAEEAGVFDLDDVARDITAKMVRRNPHVFPPGPATMTAPAPSVESSSSVESAEALDVAAVNELWESVKHVEKGLDQLGHEARVTAGLPSTLPALLYADKVLDRLGRAGAPVEVDPGSDDLGDRLLALVAEARATGADPEQALRDAVRRRL
jgi:XTP/dITP diphosphohydrolase